MNNSISAYCEDRPKCPKIAFWLCFCNCKRQKNLRFGVNCAEKVVSLRLKCARVYMCIYMYDVLKNEFE